MHPTFKWVCQLKIIKSCIFVLHLQSLQNSFLPLQGKGLLGGGFCKVRGSYLHVSTQTRSLWCYTEHYELNVAYIGPVHSAISLRTKAERQSHAGNWEANSHIQSHLKDVISTIKASWKPFFPLLLLTKIRKPFRLLWGGDYIAY